VGRGRAGDLLRFSFEAFLSGPQHFITFTSEIERFSVEQRKLSYNYFDFGFTAVWDQLSGLIGK